MEDEIEEAEMWGRGAKKKFRREQAALAQIAGDKLTSAEYGIATVEIYEGGYVRIAENYEGADSAGRVTSDTPYEKLISVSYEGVQEATGPDLGGVAVASAVLPAVSRFAKFGGSLMRATVPGLAAAALSEVAANRKGEVLLVIVTDSKVHTLSNRIGSNWMGRVSAGYSQVGRMLEETAAALLQPGSQVGDSDDEFSDAQIPNSPRGLGDQMRELAALHSEGILSDEEYVSAKARLLSGF